MTLMRLAAAARTRSSWTRVAASAVVGGTRSALAGHRSYSFTSLKPKPVPVAPTPVHVKNRELDRDLILKVMGTIPSPREARQFLSRFSPAPPVATDAANFVDSLLWETNHLALIKLEGPFTQDGLAAICQTLVQLQKLGLMSIVMLDNRDWWKSESLLDGSSTTMDLAAFGGESQDQHAGTVRRRMMSDMIETVQEIERVGGKARPVYEGIFRGRVEGLSTSHLGGSESETGAGAGSEPLTGSTMTLTLSIEDGLDPIKSCLKLGQIPVVIPMATTLGSQQVPVQCNEGLTTLATHMGALANGTNNGSASRPLVPMRLIVINSAGGIPLTRKYGTQGPTHSFVNLKDEYHSILDDLDHMKHVSEDDAMTYRTDLDMIRTCLDALPPTCSALITSSPSLTLITNLITDKPLFSSTVRGSDPKVMLATTVLRSGLDIFNFRGSLKGLDLDRLSQLLESSFGRPLDAQGYYERIQDSTMNVILAGRDYMGGAIVTQEGGRESTTLTDPQGRKRMLASVAYLDKFSVAPKSQGIGVADILWKRLQDEFPDLVWRSRSDNPVNKWYFDRSDGNVKVPGTNWTVFWYGPKGLALIRDYVEICKDITPSFVAAAPKANKSKS